MDSQLGSSMRLLPQVPTCWSHMASWRAEGAADGIQVGKAPWPDNQIVVSLLLPKTCPPLSYPLSCPVFLMALPGSTLHPGHVRFLGKGGSGSRRKGPGHSSWSPQVRWPPCTWQSWDSMPGSTPNCHGVLMDALTSRGVGLSSHLRPGQTLAAVGAGE